MADEDVVIRLSGDAGALIATIQQATERFDMLRQTLATTSDAAKVFGQTFAEQADAWLGLSDSVQLYQAKLDYLNSQMALTRDQQDMATQTIRDYTTQLSLARDAMNLLNDAQEVMGDGFAMQADEWLRAATSADDYAARLGYVREQIAMVQDQMAIANGAESTGMGGMLGGLFGGGGGFFSGLVGMADNAGILGDMAGPFGILAGAVDGAANSVSGFIEQSVAFVTSIAAWTIIQDAIQWVDQLATELFNLQVQTEKAGTGWSYMLGGGPTQQGVAQSHDLMQWLSTFSLNMPFTKQDAMSASTALISMGGANEGQTEALLPAIADIAATYGSATHNGQGTSLAQAAYAIAMFRTSGYSRMLKMDLGITPEMLMPYGLKGTPTATGIHITDQNSVYEALIRFANAKVPNAAQGIVGSTWWGGYSSLIDNIQNFLTELGGTNMNGDIRNGSFFASIKSDLDALLQWFGAHKDELQNFADIASHLLGDVTNAGGGMLAQLAQWFEKLGGVGSIEQSIENIDEVVRQWFGMDVAQPAADKQHPMGGRAKLAAEYTPGPPDWFNELVKGAESLAQISWDAITTFFKVAAQDGPTIAQQMGLIAQDFSQMGSSMTPEERKYLDDFMSLMGSATAGSFANSLFLIDQAIKTINMDMQILSPLFQLMAQQLATAQQEAHYFALALQDVATWLQHMPNSLPPWLRGLTVGGIFGGPSSVGGSGSNQGQVTRTPGAYRSFGVVGA